MVSILVLNAGSSSLKFSLFDEPLENELAAGLVEYRGPSQPSAIKLRSAGAGEMKADAQLTDYGEAARWILRLLAERDLAEPIGIVGHRVVHGGSEFHRPTRIDRAVRASLEQISKLAPLHNPPALQTIDSASAALAAADQVAVFDTGFFADLPLSAILYPLPYEWYERYGIRRFGFHGISHGYCAERAAELLDHREEASLRLVICHLGSGCSATAVRGGCPQATTMGFTPLEGLMMGTRSGSFDPGILLHLLRQADLDQEQLDRALNQGSGLLGVSGVSADFRQVQSAADAGNQRAQLAMTLFADRIRGAIGSLTVTLGGIDALVFTGGIGEHSPELRRRVLAGLDCLGLRNDERKNQTGRADCDIATSDSPGRILVLHTREQLTIARQARQLVVSENRK